MANWKKLAQGAAGAAGAGEEVNVDDLFVAYTYEGGGSSEISTQDYTTERRRVPAAFALSDDGVYVYQSIYFDYDSTYNDHILQYELTTPWDLSTMPPEPINSLDVSGKEASPYGLHFKPDGTKMYVAGFGSDSIHEYSLSTAWDISTASFVRTKAIQANANPNCRDIYFKPDGTELYVSEIADQIVTQYSLSTAWDISTLSYTGSSGSVGGSNSLRLSDDGTRLWIGISGFLKIHTLTTAWDITSTQTSYTSQERVYIEDGTNYIDTYHGIQIYGDRLYILGQLLSAWMIGRYQIKNDNTNHDAIARKTIVSGINLKDDGGLVWTKARESTSFHYLQDTDATSNTHALRLPQTDGNIAATQAVVSFNEDGISYGTDTNVNSGGEKEFISWQFKKHEKFFDIVTYSGNGSNSRTISHNLNSDVGMIIVKRTDSSSAWAVWHRGLTQSGGTGGGAYNISLNDSSSEYSTSYINSASSSNFTVGGGVGFFNTSGAEYVAYIFAHNDGDATFGTSGDKDIIKCGGYTGDGTAGKEIDVGFSPQFVMTKKVSGSGDWRIFDLSRGCGYADLVSTTPTDEYIQPNTTPAAGTGGEHIGFTPTGFRIESTHSAYNTNGGNYIYVAIRENTRTPTDATTVFHASYYWDNNIRPVYPAPFKPSMAFKLNTTGGSSYPLLFTEPMMGRLSSYGLRTSNGNASLGDYQYYFSKSQRGWSDTTASTGTFSDSLFSLMWKQAPEFFATHAYKGYAVNNRQIPHSLGTTPKMVWIKRHDGYSDWVCYHAGYNAHSPTSYYELSGAKAAQDGSTHIQAVSSTHLTLGTNANVNGSNNLYVCYLFGEVAGVSKIGSYTGNGSSSGPTVDCGFDGGPRYVLIKAASTTGEWYFMNYLTGISSGNDFFLKLNSTASGSSTSNIINPTSTGFQVVNSGAGFNTSGETYIFYAIA